MNKFLKQVTLTAATMAALTSTAMAAEGTVNVDSTLRLRQESNTSSAILANLSNNTVVDVTAVTENGWFQVNYNGQTGFVSGEYLVVGAEEVATLPVLKDPIYGVVAEGPLNVRSEASTESAPVNILGAGSVVTIVDDSIEGWYQVEDGFMSAQYIEVVTAEEAASLKAAQEQATSTSTASSTGSAIADFALKYLGSPYVYGGTSPSGFDCSGYAQYVYKNMGISINRTASTQYQQGVAVSKANLQPGDLVFFANNGVSISHVSIYIGNNKIIHASTPSTGVIISDLSSNYYMNTYFGARRMV